MATILPASHADKIQWLNDIPVWVDQWSLPKEKIGATSSLVQEQLEAGHLVESQSPWNTPIFVIKKKSGKWRLLQDLRKVNETMVPLQPGLLYPVAIPKGYYQILIDLKDCFFTIPLHPEDCERFAFSIPSIKFKEPMKRCQWTVLSQGIANSPTLCQKFVAQAIQPVRQQWPVIYIIHYTDGVLVAGKDPQDLLLCYRDLQKALADKGLQITPEKIQTQDPYNYLDFRLTNQAVFPQKIVIRRDNLKTLNDFQKLLGDINWLCPYLKLTKGELKPLFDILKGSSDPTSHRSLTSEGLLVLKVERAIEEQFVTYLDYSLPLQLLIFNTIHMPTGLLWQRAPLTWIHWRISPKHNILPYYEAVAQMIILGRKQGTNLFWQRARYHCSALYYRSRYLAEAAQYVLVACSNRIYRNYR
jgi:hypothetical protein